MMRKLNHQRKTHPDEFIKGTRHNETIWFINQADASRKLGCSRPAITKALNGETRTVMGWHLIYVPRTDNPELMNKVIRDREERENRTINRKRLLTERKRQIMIDMRQFMNTEREKMRRELSQLVSEYRLAKDRTDELSRQIQSLKKKIEESDFKKRKWELHAVQQYDMEGNLIKEWRCASDIRKELGIDINRCVKGEKESMGGYRWQYRIPRDIKETE